MVAAGLRSMYHDKSISQPTSEPMLESLSCCQKAQIAAILQFYIGIQYVVSTVLPSKPKLSTWDGRLAFICIVPTSSGRMKDAAVHCFFSLLNRS
eukprot:scaffold6595_cov92-Skeletonema_marinoi.AAC.3